MNMRPASLTEYRNAQTPPILPPRAAGAASGALSEIEATMAAGNSFEAAYASIWKAEARKAGHSPQVDPSYKQYAENHVRQARLEVSIREALQRKPMRLCEIAPVVKCSLAYLRKVVLIMEYRGAVRFVLVKDGMALSKVWSMTDEARE